MIVSFGAPFDVSAPGRPVTTHGESFVGRVSELPATVEFAGTSAGIQVDFTPLGAQMFCGLPMNEVPDPAIGLGDLFGAEGSRLTEMIAGTPADALRPARRGDPAPLRERPSRRPAWRGPGGCWS